MKRITLFSLVFFISLIFIACSKEKDESVTDPLAGLKKLKEGYAVGAATKVEIWSDKDFFVGYNKVIVVLYDSLIPTQKITDAHIRFQPVMTMQMGMMEKRHACPVENPEEIAVNDVFPGAVVFIMATDSSGSWKLEVAVHNHNNDKEGKVNFDITVDNTPTSLLKMFTTRTDSSRLILTLVQPMEPKIGVNDIEFTLHKKVDMMNFSADDTHTIEIIPEMPSMGHGSPNNVNPVNVGKGHYKGKVNFTMTGEWRINVLVRKDSILVADNVFFNLVL